MNDFQYGFKFHFCNIQSSNQIFINHIKIKQTKLKELYRTDFFFNTFF